MSAALVLATFPVSSAAAAEEDDAGEVYAPAGPGTPDRPSDPEGRNGFKLGPMRVHIEASLEGGYDSNVYYTDPDDQTIGGLTGGPVLRLVPSLEGLTPHPSKLDMRLKAELAYRQYFTRATLRESDVAGTLALGLIVNPKEPISFILDETFTRRTETPYSPGAGRSFDRDVNSFGLGIRIKPGGGAFSVDLMLRNYVSFWENNDLALFSYMLNEVELRSKWKFFPKTAVTYELSVGYNNYFVGQATAFGYYNVDSFPLRTYLGLIGLLTPKIQFMLKAGYGNSFHRLSDLINPPEATSFQGPLIGARLTFRVSYRSKLSLIYARDFQDAVFSNYYVKDEGKIVYDQAIGSRFVGHLGVTGGYLRYDAAPPVGGGVTLPGTDRQEFRLAGDVRLEFHFNNWLNIHAWYRLSANFSGYVVSETGGTDDPSFIKHEVFAGLTGRY